MDRLICGDVGYGKTEVALRAAFKAVADGKQVLMLVPTTILAQQHYGTFAERLRDYPFTVEHVSRFRSAAEQRAAITGFAEGKVDILIGTHRLLSRDVRAKDLGLLIVDEEQRFGVKQKELLRQLQAEGRRDRDVGHADPAHAADVAGRPARHLGDRDAARGPAARSRPTSASTTRSSCAGARARARARRPGLLPAQPRGDDRRDRRSACAACARALRFEVAHGQLEEKALEERMLAFLRGDADVLVCTSDHRVGHRHPAGQHADRRARRHLRPGPALPDPRPRRAAAASAPTPTCCIPRAAALTPDAAQRLTRAVGLHRAGRRLQDRDARPGDPRRREPARRRAVRPRGRARLRALHADARRGRARAAGRGRGRGGRAGARAPRRQRRRLRARRLHPLRAGQDRRAPPHRRGARGRRARARCARSSRTASARRPSRWAT